MAQKRVAIVQSSYIPWKGYFDLIRAVDEFILLDDVQFTRRDWRTRNRIKTTNGPAWLTIPVNSKGRYLQRIDETTIADPRWAERHWATIRASYARAPYFKPVADAIEPLYRNPGSDRLSEVNQAFIIAICAALEIGTRITWSTDYQAREGRNERLIDLCRQSGADEYLSGPRAAAYMDEGAWRDAGIVVRFADYSDYPEYPQLHPPFAHDVTALDLLFNTGPRARDYLKDLCPAHSPA